MYLHVLTNTINHTFFFLDLTYVPILLPSYRQHFFFHEYINFLSLSFFSNKRKERKRKRRRRRSRFQLIILVLVSFSFSSFLSIVCYESELLSRSVIRIPIFQFSLTRMHIYFKDIEIMLMKFLAGFSDRALVSEPENSSGRTITKSTSTPASLQAIVRVHGGNNSSLHQKVNIPNEGNTRVEFFNRSDADVTQRLKTARLILSRSPAFIDCVRFPRCCYVTVERMEKEERERREEI